MFTQTATAPYPKPFESSSCIRILFKIPFNFLILVLPSRGKVRDYCHNYSVPQMTSNDVRIEHMFRHYKAIVRYLCLIYLLTAIGLTPGGSSTVHIDTRWQQYSTHSHTTIHRTTQLTTLVGRLSGTRTHSFVRTQSGNYIYIYIYVYIYIQTLCYIDFASRYNLCK